MYTTTDIRSHCKPDVLYAPKGVLVEVVAESGHVVICEWRGSRFPVLLELLSDTEPLPDVVEQVVVFDLFNQM